MAEKEKTTGKEKMTIVVFSGELDKALAAFMIATTGASMGMDVSMFFTFWGLNVIKKDKGVSGGKGFMKKMLNFMNRGGPKRLKLSKFHMMGLGTGMMKKLMQQHALIPVDEFIQVAKELGVKMIPCSTTCGLMGLNENDFHEEVGDMAGAAFFINEARQSKVNLFI